MNRKFNLWCKIRSSYEPLIETEGCGFGSVCLRYKGESVLLNLSTIYHDWEINHGSGINMYLTSMIKKVKEIYRDNQNEIFYWKWREAELLKSIRPRGKGRTKWDY